MTSRRFSCYRVSVSSASSPILTWTRNGIDQKFLLPRRSHTIIVAARNEKEAIRLGLIIGRALLGGRGVQLGKVELKCLPGSHRSEFIAGRHLPDARPDRTRVKITQQGNWDWLTKPVKEASV